MARSTVQVPETPHSAPHLRVIADLHLEVGDGAEVTAAHLRNDPDGLVLDVDDPAVMLRAVPGRGLARDLPIKLPPELFAATPLLVRSAGRDLGWVRLSTDGKLRLRPTLAGLAVAVRTATPDRIGRPLVVSATAVVTTALLAAAVRRLLRR